MSDSLHCTFCGGGPLTKADVVVITAKEQDFILCGSWHCILRMFKENDPATFPATASICPSCENRPVVATITDRAMPSFDLCERCILALFFDRSAIR